MSDRPLLRLRGASRAYPGPPEVTALRGVDLDIARGEIVAIEGPSGGGKSTLLNMIGLLDQPTAGQVEVAGRAMRGRSEREAAETRSDLYGFIFQNFHLLDRRPVFDSVELGMMYRAIAPVERRERAMGALEKVGLGGYGDRLAYELSGGQRQRVAIARALSTGAPVLIADEPTGNLDSANASQVVDALRMANAQGATIVLVTHSPEVAAVAPRRITIRDGVLHDHSDARLVRNESGNSEDPTPGVLDPPAGRASRLRAGDLVRDAVSGLLSKTPRTLALAAAVALGVGLTIATVGVSDSARAQVASSFDRFVNRDVTVSWDDPTLGGQQADFVDGVTDRLRQLSGVDHVGILTRLSSIPTWITAGSGPLQPQAFAISDDVAAAARLVIEWAPNHPHELAADEVLVGGLLATQLELGPLALVPTLFAGDRVVTVAGIIDASPREPQFLGAVVIPDTDLRAGDVVVGTDALIYTMPGAAQQVARQAPLAVSYFSPETLQVRAPPDPHTMRGEVESSVQVTLLIVSGIALLGAIASLTNAMVLALTERRQEIGLRRAVGARRRHISSLILVEAVIIGFAGGVAGLIAGLLAVLGVTVSQGWMPVFDLRLALVAIVGGVVVGGLGGILAAGRAARIEPADALRQ